MLVIISDLHLQESDAKAEDFAKDNRNVSIEALSLLFAEIHEKVEEGRAKEVILCLAGDIFEISRSPYWFQTDFRPYHLGLPDPKCEVIIQHIAERIVGTHQEFFAALRRFQSEGRFSYHGDDFTLASDIKVEVRYLPGNHDRLLGAFPKVRAYIRSALGIAGGEDPFVHEFLYPFDSSPASYGVLIRHGHEYDASNFSQTAKHLGEARYQYSCLGDVMTSEFVAFYPVHFSELYGALMKEQSGQGEMARQLYQALLDFDDVRPASSLFGYLMSCVEKGKKIADEIGVEDITVKLLRPLVSKAFATVSTRELLHQELQNPLLKLVFLPPGRWLVQALLNAIPNGGLAWMLHLVGWLLSRVESKGPSRFAANEPALRDGRVHTVIAGHTHHPDQVPIETDKSFFLDSGTWRTLIYQGDSHTVFGRLRAITFVFAFRSDEANGRRRFETWTGHLAKL